mmetsp:Transcript_18382/g.29628  ORF Transcript_18382/g.29628 Transcript_18382/m.29628 type:complete len:242 (-) Transcript_18382:579-1304(-)
MASIDTSPSVLKNNEACKLLEEGHHMEAYALFEVATMELRHSIGMGAPAPQPRDLRCKSSHLSSDSKTTASDFLPLPSFNLKVYCRPVKLRVGGENTPEETVAFALTFNLALALHVRAIELANNGEKVLKPFNDAEALYKLSLRQATINLDATHGDLGLSFTEDRNGYVYAAIFNNLAHIHKALGKDLEAVASGIDLMNTLFWVVTRRPCPMRDGESKLFDAFMKNASQLTMASTFPAAAA